MFLPCTDLANSEMEEQERENNRDQALMGKYMSKVSPLSGHLPEKQLPLLNQKSGQIGEQQISIVSPDQVNVLQTELPTNNPEVSAFLSKGKRRSNFINNILKRSLTAGRKPLVYGPRPYFQGSEMEVTTIAKRHESNTNKLTKSVDKNKLKSSFSIGRQLERFRKHKNRLIFFSDS